MGDCTRPEYLFGRVQPPPANWARSRQPRRLQGPLAHSDELARASRSPPVSREGLRRHSTTMQAAILDAAAVRAPDCHATHPQRRRRCSRAGAGAEVARREQAATQPGREQLVVSTTSHSRQSAAVTVLAHFGPSDYHIRQGGRSAWSRDSSPASRVTFIA